MKPSAGRERKVSSAEAVGYPQQAGHGAATCCLAISEVRRYSRPRRRPLVNARRENWRASRASDQQAGPSASDCRDALQRTWPFQGVALRSGSRGPVGPKFHTT